MSSSPRITYARFNEIAPSARSALLALGKAADDAGLDKALSEIVKVRVSQINGCAFCLALHLDIARKLGVPAEKLDLLAVWQEAGVFTEREQAALAWAEALTHCSEPADHDALYTRLRSHFTETEAVFLTVAIGTINQWNRIAGSLGFTPILAKSGA